MSIANTTFYTEPLLRPQQTFRRKVRTKTQTYTPIPSRCPDCNKLHRDLRQRCSLLGRRAHRVFHPERTYGTRPRIRRHNRFRGLSSNIAETRRPRRSRAWISLQTLRSMSIRTLQPLRRNALRCISSRRWHINRLLLIP